MLENVNLKRKLSREEYREILPGLQQRLYDLEKACWDHGIPSMLVFEGWDAAGKGTAISTLTQRLDPRGFKLYPITAPRTYEEQRPWLWRFWLKVPDRGEMVLFDHSWYTHLIERRVTGGLSDKVWKARTHDIADFERTLADDGVVILKFFLHISRKEQKKRFEEIEKDPLESWRVTSADWRRHKLYSRYAEAFEEMFEHTEAEYAPWTIVEATSRWYARRKIFATLIEALERRLGADAPPAVAASEASQRGSDLRDAMESLVGQAEEG